MPSLKVFLIVYSVFTLHSVHALSEKLNELNFLVDDNNYVIFMSHYDATGTNEMTGKKEKPDVCAKFGGRIPTIREWATLFQISEGVKGIVELKQSKNGKPGKTYTKVVAVESDGSIDKFYYSAMNFKFKNHKFSISTYWSSSISPLNSENAFVIEDRHYGTIQTLDRSELSAVRCIIP